MRLSYSQDGESLVYGDGRSNRRDQFVFYDAATGERQRSIAVPSSSTRYFINVRHQLFGNFVGSDHRHLGSGDRPGAPAAARVHFDPQLTTISPDGSRIVFGKRPAQSRGGESELSLWSLKSGRRLLALNREGTV